MKTKEEIEAKYEELNKRMESVVPWDSFNVASIDGQRYIIEWILGQHD